MVANQRYFNAFRSKKIDIDFFKKEDCKNLEYGIVVLQDNDSIDIYNDIFGAYPLFIKTKNGKIKYIGSNVGIRDAREFISLRSNPAIGKTL